MELNTHTEHNHATTSLKVLLLVFAVLLVGALGYMVYQQNTEPDTADYSAPKITAKKTTTDTTKADTSELIACGDTNKYGFELAFESALWKDYEVKKWVANAGIVYCYFNVPTSSTETIWTQADFNRSAKYASVFAVSITSPELWQEIVAGANPPTELGHNDDYYWGWAPSQSLPQDLQDSNISADVKNVVATFKISK